MMKKTQMGFKPLPQERSIIAISCLHLGGQEDHETSLSLCRFLDHLPRGPAKLEIPGCSTEESKEGAASRTRTVYPPDRIILLGDNQDLWDPWNQDRNRSYLDAIFPIMKMQKMDCDVIWVTGNHDEDTAELIESADQLMEDRKKGRPKVGVKEECSDLDFEIIYGEDEIWGKMPASMKFPWGNSRIFEICSRHYPEPTANDKRKGYGRVGLEVGKFRYAFLHGQQFDKWQITHKISKVLGTRFDPLDFFEDLANISVTKRMRMSHALNLMLFAFLLALLVRPSYVPTLPFVGDSGQVIVLIGALCSIGLIIVSFSGIILFGYPFWKIKIFKDRKKENKQTEPTDQTKEGAETVPPDKIKDSPKVGRAISSLLAGVSAFASLLFIGMFLSGLSGNKDVFWYLFLILFAISLYILAVMTLPVAIAWAKRNLIYKFIISAKEMSAIQIEEEERFKRDDFSYEADVVVFGHTHKADFEVVKGDQNENKPKNDFTNLIERFFKGYSSKVSEKDDVILLNAGSWVFEEKNLARKDFDTFVYIDNHGLCLLRWNNAKEKIECFCKEKGDTKVPVCDYILKNYRAPDRSAIQ